MFDYCLIKRIEFETKRADLFGSFLFVDSFDGVFVRLLTQE